MGIPEALQALEDADPQEFAEQLQENASPFFSAIRDPAYQEGKSDAEQETEKAREKIASLKKEKQDLAEKVEDLEGDRPDEAELRGKYEEKMKTLQEQINSLQSDLEDERSDKNQQLRSKEQEFFKERAVRYLVEQGVKDPDIAEIKVERAIDNGRVEFDDDLNPTVYNENEVPEPMNNGKAPHEVFGKTVLQGIKDDWLEDPKPGSTRLGSTGSGDEQKIARSRFEDMSQSERKQFVQDGGEVVDD